MFNDEERTTCRKMHDLSPADGFAEISENLADMIKLLANEPSVGLFFVQQHSQKAVPNLVNLKNNIVKKNHETALLTEDLDDSIAMVASMKDCGCPIVDDMITEIRNSLSIISTKKPKRGLLQSSSSSFLGRAGSWSPATWGSNKVYSQSDVEKSGGYLSGVLKSAKQRAGGFKWSQGESLEALKSKGESGSFDLGPGYPSADTSVCSSIVESEIANNPLSSENSCGVQEEPQPSKSSSDQHLLTLYENFDEFKAVKEARFEEWLGGTGDEGRKTADTDGLAREGSESV